jgi:hypothetical protein
MTAQQLGQQPTHGSYQSTFNYSRIDNIPVRDLMAGVNLPPRKPLNMNQVNVDKDFLERFAPPIGVIRTWNNQILAGCFLISNNLAMMAWHSISELEIQPLMVNFDLTNGSSNGQPNFNVRGFIEYDPELDYAIIELDGVQQQENIRQAGEVYGYINIDTGKHNSDSLLLHMPARSNYLLANINRSVQMNYLNNPVGYHNSGAGSSGYPYINPEETCSKMHLGSEVEGPFQHETKRYALAFAQIIAKHPGSIIASLVNHSTNEVAFWGRDIDIAYVDPEGNFKRQKRSQYVQRERESTQAAGRAKVRTDNFAENWQKMKFGEFVRKIPQLGATIFNPGNITNTSTNKIEFQNPTTGWIAVQDKGAIPYLRIMNEAGQYLNSAGQPSFDQAETHFRNS